MANNVHFRVDFHLMNEDAKSKLTEMYERIRKGGDFQLFGDMFVDQEQVNYADVDDGEWSITNLGAKWCYFEEFNEDGFHGYAAWRAPEDGMMKLASILGSLDANFVASMTFEDEGPNFIGANVYWGTFCQDGFEDDEEDIRDKVINASKVLTSESWDSELDERCDEAAEQTFNDELWEVMNEVQWDFVTEQVNSIKAEVSG